jgi:hypothetical protein
VIKIGILVDACSSEGLDGLPFGSRPMIYTEDTMALHAHVWIGVLEHVSNSANKKGCSGNVKRSIMFTFLFKPPTHHNPFQPPFNCQFTFNNSSHSPFTSFFLSFAREFTLTSSLLDACSSESLNGLPLGSRLMTYTDKTMALHAHVWIYIYIHTHRYVPIRRIPFPIQTRPFPTIPAANSRGLRPTVD